MPTASSAPEPRPRAKLCVVILNYRTPDLVEGALRSLDGQISPPESLVVVVDNDSGDGSDHAIEATIERAGYGDWARLIRAGRNGGFSAGNNVGIRAVDAEYYLLLNSDTIVRPGAVAELMRQIEAHPEVGIASPRLEWPDGTPQESCFRDPDGWTEFLGAASTGPITKLLPDREVFLPVQSAPIDVEWTSFACVLIRREVIQRVGLMDEGYFMYFEDADYCRATRESGFRVRHFPSAHVVHLRGGSSDVKKQKARRRRPPKYFYESRMRYFRKHYGTAGAVGVNVMWSWGRGIHFLRERLLGTESNSCEREWLDNWTGLFRLQEGER